MALPTKPLRIAAVSAGVLGLALAAALLYGIPGAEVHEPAPPAVLDKLELATERKKAPDPGFSDAEGNNVTLADFRGRFVVLNLWATWCTPCVAELPALARLKEALGESVVVVPVDLENIPPEKAKEFLARNGAAGLPVYVDRERKLMRANVAFGLPFTAIIDPEGYEVARSFGPQEWDHPDVVAYLLALAKS
jgi:thiol-disulfide isomerase/thioredoxin